jgi:hypothetical protein
MFMNKSWRNVSVDLPLVLYRNSRGCPKEVEQKKEDQRPEPGGERWGGQHDSPHNSLRAASKPVENKVLCGDHM